jgi:hypothetical protein
MSRWPRGAAITQAIRIMWSRKVFEVLFIVAWSMFSVWTIRRLNYLGSREAGSTTYRYGVKGFGIMLWVPMVVVGVAMGWAENPNRSVWYYGFVMAFTLLPVCLWGGYVWGAVMSSLFPRRRDK